MSNYDMWKLRSPDDERPCGDDPEPEIEEMDEDDWLEKQEIEMTEKQPQVSDDGTAETAAEIAHFEPVESYIRDLFSEPSSLTDDEKTLIAGNIRAFYATIHPFELDEMDRQMIDEAWESHKAARQTPSVMSETLLAPCQCPICHSADQHEQGCWLKGKPHIYINSIESLVDWSKTIEANLQFEKSPPT